MQLLISVKSTCDSCNKLLIFMNDSQYVDLYTRTHIFANVCKFVLICSSSVNVRKLFHIPKSFPRDYYLVLRFPYYCSFPANGCMFFFFGNIHNAGVGAISIRVTKVLRQLVQKHTKVYISSWRII